MRLRLRDVIGQPTDVVRAKLSDHVNELTRQFIERSPFVCVATSRPDGGLDVSREEIRPASSECWTRTRC